MAVKSGPARKTLTVILDSNALFVPIQFKIDIFKELKTLLNRNYRAVVLKPVHRELERLANEGPPTMMKNAAYALKLAERCHIINVKENAVPPDDAILEIATKRNWPVFTNDRELRKRLRNINVPVIYVRQKSRLEIDGRL